MSDPGEPSEALRVSRSHRSTGMPRQAPGAALGGLGKPRRAPPQRVPGAAFGDPGCRCPRCSTGTPRRVPGAAPSVFASCLISLGAALEPLTTGWPRHSPWWSSELALPHYQPRGPSGLVSRCFLGVSSLLAQHQGPSDPAHIHVVHIKTSRPHTNIN